MLEKMIEFDFIADEKFRAILVRDFEELTKCLEVKASKSVLVLSGSIIESILCDYFSNFPPPELETVNILNTDLFKLIDLAFQHDLIGNTTKDLSTVVKNYRNLIHPGREIRKKETFNFDSALVAKSLLNIIISEIKENYIKHVGHTAHDIISKLENDSISQSLFDKIISKLRKTEKIRLYNILIDYKLNNIAITQLTDPKKYISILKTQVGVEIIKNQFKKLVNKIEKGEKWEIMTYYYLLFEDLKYADEHSIDLILLYIINALSESTKNKNVLSEYNGLKLFSTIGAHVVRSEVQEEFFKLAVDIVQGHTKNTYGHLNAYDQIINSVGTEIKEKMVEYINNSSNSYYTNSFYSDYDNGNYLPF